MSRQLEKRICSLERRAASLESQLQDQQQVIPSQCPNTLDCIEYKNILGQMTVQINTTTNDWNRLLETGLWDKVVDILNNKPKSLEERVSDLESEVKHLKEK